MASFKDIISSQEKVLVDFHATWCGPCKTLSPILSDLKNSLGQDLKLIKIDVDKNQSLATKMNVKGVPTIIYYKNGVQQWRKSGVIPKDELIKLIQ